MSLRRKMLLVLLVIIIALIAILNVISWVFIRGNYLRQEKDAVRSQLERGLSVYSDNLDNLDATLKDWAYWDDTYAFIEDRNEAYIEANLAGWALQNLGINMIVFVDQAGRIVYGASLDADGLATPSIPESLKNQFSREGVLLRPAATGQGIKGSLLLPEGPLLIAGEPILDSHGNGPARGTLLMARYLDEAELANLSKLSHETLTAIPIDAPDLPQGYSEAEVALSRGQADFIKPAGSDQIDGYTMIDDIYGQAAIILKVEMPRDTYWSGIRTLVYFSIFLLATCLILGLTIWLLLEKLVIARAEHLSSEIIDIGRSGRHDARVQASGRDELASLGASINTMLEELEHIEGRFRGLIENALDIILILDAAGQITYQSPSVQTVLGYGKGELIGKSLADILSEPDAEAGREAWLRLAQSPGAIDHREIHVRRSDGSWRNIESIACNLLDHPDVGGIVVNGRDITIRRIMVDRLEKINELFIDMGADFSENVMKIIASCRDVLDVPLAAYYRQQAGKSFMLTTDSGDGKFERVSQPVEGIADWYMSAGRQEPLVIDDIGAGKPTGLSRIVKDRGFNTLVALPVVLQETPVGCLIAFGFAGRHFSPDETRLMGTLAHALMIEEERLGHEQKLKDFMDIASHELRHPITLMKGYALTLRDSGDRLDAESKKMYLSIINEAADRLNALIKELLDVSRMEQGRFTLLKESCDIKSLLEQAVEEMNDKGFEGRFSISLEGQLGSRRMDREKMVRVLVILLDNAVLHSDEESGIELQAVEDDGKIVVSVLDQGLGIPEKDRERIFERFYQVEETLHHTSSGIGLGLYIARQIVQAHGGDIWCEGREGGGSAFRFTIP